MNPLRRRVRRSIPAACAAIIALAVLSAAPAVAVSPPADEYGAHVVHCAQEHGFEGEHNPAMHLGRSGWDGGHVC
jgi:hypothetical protein